MSPNYCQGGYVVSLSWPLTRYKANDVVVLNHPIYNTIIKRIQYIEDEKSIYIFGDNPNSLSSLSLGVITRKHILGKVIWYIPEKQ